MDYKSPIEAIYHDFQLQFEDNVYKTVQAVDIHVDRDELIKALQYDRQQYEKGWHDALLKEQEPVRHGYWATLDDTPSSYRFHCSECGAQVFYPQATRGETRHKRICKYKYCPNCRAKMDLEADDEL